MPTVISALLPNTQFTQASTANTLLTPLVNDAITVEGTPKIWLCGPDGKGSLHTLDYSGNPSEIIICPNSPPNTTTNKQNFMYYKNVGGNWTPSANFVLPWVPWGTRLITGNYTDPTALDGQFLWTNFTQQDPLRTTVAPYPLTMNPNVTGDNRYHWSSICTSNPALSVADQINQTRETALFGTAANLISPSYVLVAHHDAPVKFWFQLPDGTEISRVRGNVTLIDPYPPGTGDIGVAKLDYPVYDPNVHPIRTIEPPVIPINPQAFSPGLKGVFMELGGRLTTFGPASNLPLSPTQYVNRVEKTWPSSPPQTGPVIQNGDSGHPFAMRAAGTTFLIGLAKTKSYSDFNGIHYEQPWLPNVTKYINEINAILATTGECLQTATVTIV